MNRILALVALFCVFSLLAADGLDPNKRFVIIGQYISEGIQESDYSVVVSYETTAHNGETEIVELLSGRLNEGLNSFEGEIEESTEVEITVHTEKGNALSTNALIVPGGESIRFAVIPKQVAQREQLVLVGESRRSINPTGKFAVLGTFYSDEQSFKGIPLLVRVSAEEFSPEGKPIRIEYGSVLLDGSKFVIEADIDEPRIAKLQVIGRARVIWETPLVIEPYAQITIGRIGPNDFLQVATSDGGRHAKLLDSWFTSTDFLAAMHAFYSAGTALLEKVGPGVPVTEGFQQLWQDVEKIKVESLKRLAWNSRDPLDSLLALELSSLLLTPGSLDHSEVLRLYDKLSASLDEDIAARRISPARERLKADVARVANSEKLQPGQKAPEFSLPNLEGTEFELSEVLKQNDLVLVDFWASWCGPCIAAFPAYKDLYSKHNENGFEIVTIAVDKNFEDWKEVSVEVEIPWINLGEIEGNYGTTAVSYGVSSLPRSFLLDDNHRILQRDITIDRLSDLLEKRYRNTSPKD